MSGHLRVRRLHWTPLGRRTPVLPGLDLDVAPGERVLVAGASGSGKSTLLRALAGLLGENEPGHLLGEVRLDGAAVEAGAGRIGLLVQDPAGACVAGRVGRDVAFGPENLGMHPGRIRRRVTAALEAVGFPYGLEHGTQELSGGEAQRLALAGVLAMGPSVILLDEPTSMLDAETATAVREAVLAVVAERGLTLLVVEHRLTGWVQGCERLVVLAPDGSVAVDGPTAQVLRHHASDLLDLGVWVPGHPAPAPLEVDPGLLSPSHPHPLGEPLLDAAGAGLVRRPRRGLAIDRHPPRPRPALIDVDLRVDVGRFHALRGDSGAGKSSLLGLLVGLETPTSGEVRARPALARGLLPSPVRWSSRELAVRGAWVPQRADLTIAGRTVLDSLLATSRALGQDPAVADRRARELLAALGLHGTQRRGPHTLSGGQARRLALASALLHGPEVLALDEPTVGQDRHTWAAVAGVATHAARAGTAVLVGTHDDDLAAHVDVTTSLSQGRLRGRPHDTPADEGAR